MNFNKKNKPHDLKRETEIIIDATHRYICNKVMEQTVYSPQFSIKMASLATKLEASV